MPEIVNMRGASVAIGCNVSYLHGFLERGSPKVLSHRDAAALAGVLGCAADELHHAERPARRGRTPSKARRPGPAPKPVEPLAEIPELVVDAAAGTGAIAGDHIEERARWRLPAAMIRYEAGGDVEAVRVLRVRGSSMEPELSDGDRLLIDTSKRKPLLRLESANPECADYSVRPEDANIVGRVLWTIRKV